MYCQVSSSGGSLSKGHALWDFVSGNKNGAQLNYEIIISAGIWWYPRSAECMRTRKKQCPNNQSNEPDAKASLLEPWTFCLLYTSPSPRDGLLSRMPSS